MQSYKVLVLVVAMATLSTSFEVTRLQRGVLDEVEGATSCGGTSGFMNMDLATCTQAPCQVQNGTIYEIGISLMSAEDTQSINWLVFLYYPNGGVSRLSDKNVEGVLEAGRPYRVSDNIQIPDRFSGIDGELSVMIMNGETGSRMICGIFPVVIA